MSAVLLVENDSLQAIQRRSLLEKRFARVERAADPAEALCLVEQPGFDFQLVVCGSQPPGFGGRAFLEELHERRPDLPVLVLGGSVQQAGEYEGPNRIYLAAPVDGDEILFYAGKLLACADHHAA